MAICDEIICLETEIRSGNPGNSQVKKIDGSLRIRRSEPFIAPHEVQRAHRFHHRLRVQSPQRPILTIAFAKERLAGYLNTLVWLPQYVNAPEMVPVSPTRL